MNEYLGIFELPYLQFITYKILAKDYSEAHEKFVKKVIELNLDNGEYINNEEYVKILPLFKIETI